MAVDSLTTTRHWVPIAIAAFAASAVVLLQLSNNNRQPLRKRKRIMVINPNTTTSMTDALRTVVENMGFQDTTYSFFTAPAGVASINDDEDARVSTMACVPALRSLIDTHDGFLVCCYSAHPLVSALRAEIAIHQTKRMGLSVNDHPIRPKPVTGIFEASVATCIQSLTFTEPIGRASNEMAKFAILTTGPQYEGLLNAAIEALLVGTSSTSEGLLQGSPSSSERFAGTFTTGLDADQLHSAPEEEVHRRMQAAATKALERGARALCLGCAGMVGLNGAVRKACVEKLGREEGERVWIVDGVVSGIAFLQGVLRSAASHG